MNTSFFGELLSSIAERGRSLIDLARDYAQDAETRGEFVVVVSPPPDEEAAPADVDDLLRRALARVP